MTVYGYIRVSTAEQAADDRTSLETQKRRIIRAAEDNGWSVDSWFSDPGISGGVPLSHRPDGSRLVAALKKGDVVIVAKLDRAFRSASDALTCAEAFREEGVGMVISDISSYAVTDSGPSKLFFGMMALVAEFERSCIAERMADGKKSKKQKGGHTGGDAPYGWCKIGVGRDAMLREVPMEQRGLAFARRLRSEGNSLRDVAKLMEDSGHLSRSGTRLGAMAVRRMLVLADRISQKEAAE